MILKENENATSGSSVGGETEKQHRCSEASQHGNIISYYYFIILIIFLIVWSINEHKSQHGK